MGYPNTDHQGPSSITPILHHSITPFLKPVHHFRHFPDINVDRTVPHAPATSRALHPAPVLVHIVLELVHEPLPHSLRLLVPRVVPGSVQREQGKHARVPVPHPV